MYAFAPDLLEQQLATARRIVGDAVVVRAGDLVQAGLDAARSAPAGLVHTDVVLTNVIWTGSAAIPVDFEFACVGPVDLDVDCVGREVVGRRDRVAIEGLRDALASTLERAGAIQRLRGYSLLRDLWALGKWADHDPSLTDATTWGPARDLIADTTQSGWIDQLLDAEH
ncbi:MAG TPA: phosphotransferase [Microlunatus sp.]